MKILVDGQTLSTPDVRRGIGRVLVQLCEELFPSDRSNEWYVAVRSADDLTALGEEAQRIAKPVVVSAPALPGRPALRARAYGDELSRLCSEHDIGLYWNPNPLMSNVTLPLELGGVPKVCTVYDLIPRMLPETYLHTWPRLQREDYEARVARLPTWADHLAFISAGSRDDWCRLSPAVAERSSVIHLGADHATFWAPAVPEPAASPPYVLVVGGPDPRKNLEGAVIAFAAARARDSRMDDCRLVVVGSGDETNRRGLAELARLHGVAECVRLLDYVDDASLARLYRQAALFFFPSLYEGFGLPVVEAMACGAPVLTSDRPELRECAGEWAWFCDPTRTDEMAEALVTAFTSRERNRATRPRAVEWARRFDWERTAALCERVDVDLFVEQPGDVETRPGIRAHPLDAIRRVHEDYDAVVYHLGNNSDHHAEIYRLAWEIPGIVVMHDFNIHPFLNHAYLDTPDEWLYRDALVEADGEIGRAHFDAVRTGRAEPDFWRYPLAQPIAARSRAVIVHSAWARDALGGEAKVFTIPLFARIREPLAPGEIAALRDSLGLPADRFVIGLFGFLNRQKRIDVILEASARLRERGYPVQLLLVGSKIDPRLPLSDQVAEHGVEDLTRHTGYVSEEEFWSYLDVCDVVMNLRFPSMGESSLSLSRAFGSGKPCVVSDFGPCAEIPDSVCWKAEVGPFEVDQVVGYLEELLGDPETRRQLGETARRFAAHYASKSRAAALYEDAIASVRHDRLLRRRRKSRHEKG